MASNNTRGGSSSWGGRMSDDEAFDLLHPDVREAIRGSVFQWSAGWYCRMQRKLGTKVAVADAARRRHEQDQEHRTGGREVNSPIISYRMKPLYA